MGVAGVPQASKPLKSDLREPRKHKTIREILSPSAEMPNLSGNDFRHARKHQAIREMTLAMRGNAKPFAERFAGGP